MEPPVVVVVGTVFTGAGSSFFLLQEKKMKVAEMKPMLKNDTNNFFLSLVFIKWFEKRWLIFQPPLLYYFEIVEETTITSEGFV